MPTINSKTVLIDNLVTTTWYDVRKDIVDAVFKITPFYDKMVEQGRIRDRVPDGTHFEIPIRYGKMDQNRKWFGRGDTFGMSEKEVLTRLYYYTRNVGTNMVRYWDDERKNRGKAQLINWADELVTNTKMSLIDGFENDLMAETITDPLQMNSLPTIISSTPTSGSLGGVSRSGNEYLQNYTKNFQGLSTATNLLDEMTTIFNKCSQWKGGTKRSPDLILTTREIYQDYERICRALQTIFTSDTIRASLGFGNLLFKNVEMFWAPNCPAGCMYFINTETLELCYDPSAWFEMTEWTKVPNSLDRMAQIVCVCNLVCDNVRKNGLIYNISTVST